MRNWLIRLLGGYTENELISAGRELNQNSMSHDISDCFEHGLLSACCGARIMLGGICSDCKEHCESEEEYDAREKEQIEESALYQRRIEETEKAWAEQDKDEGRLE